MWREGVLKVVLVVGSLFTAGIYSVMMTLGQRYQSGYTNAKAIPMGLLGNWLRSPIMD
jgi:hypothetical protein